SNDAPTPSKPSSPSPPRSSASNAFNNPSETRSKGLFDEVEFSIVGARELRELYRRATTAVTVTFTMEKKVALPKIPGIGEAYLGLLPASTLVDIVTDKGGNIRK